MTRNITVLLAVHNGGAFLRPQIESILAQRDVTVTLVVRDDGSTDGTPAILRDYAVTHPNITVHGGPNLGVKDAFLSLLAFCPPSSDYVAFSDADDVWLPEKLREAVSMLAGIGPADRPALYGSRVRLADNALNELGVGPGAPRGPSFSNAMVECRAAGATCVLNRAALRLLQQYDYRDAVTHDAWVYLVIAAFGVVVLDERSFILYRQHSRNQVGGRPSLTLRWRRRLERAARAAAYRRQALSLLRQAERTLAQERLRPLRRFVRHRDGIAQRVGFALRPSVTHQTARSDWFYRVLVILGRT